MTIEEELANRSWVNIPFDAELLGWAETARPHVDGALRNPQHAAWHRHGGTWFVGVHALDNGADGALGSTPFPPALLAAIRTSTEGAEIAWDRGQISVCFPGYPQPSPVESDAAHRFRIQRDAAHVDGLHGEGPQRRRHLREYHQFILGIPIDGVQPGMAPFVVWEGSHLRFQAMFRKALDCLPAAAWGDIDLTDSYHATRREAFAACRRVEVTARPGEAYVVHRFALHGMAAWTAPPSDGLRRAIVYFRPETEDREAWLRGP